jgi:hypothetical protein
VVIEWNGKDKERIIKDKKWAEGVGGREDTQFLVHNSA